MKANESGLKGILPRVFRLAFRSFPLLPLAFFCGRVSGLELSLEENRGQRGTVGFVDMERLFREYPETLRAKEQFEREVEEKSAE